jgi:hypothetical protein
MIVIAYFIVAFLFNVLINVFDWLLIDEIVDADWAISMFWIVCIPIFLLACIFVSIGDFAEWLANKIKDMLGW